MCGDGGEGELRVRRTAGGGDVRKDGRDGPVRRGGGGGG